MCVCVCLFLNVAAARFCMQSWLVCAELSQSLDWRDQFRHTSRRGYNAGPLARLDDDWAPCHKGTRAYESADLIHWDECFQYSARRTRSSVTSLFVELDAYEETLRQANLDGIEGANAYPQSVCGYESGPSSSARAMLELLLELGLTAGAGCAVGTVRDSSFCPRGYFACPREELSWKLSSPDSAHPSGHRELFTRFPGRSQAHPNTIPRANQASYPRISSPDLASALCTSGNVRIRSTANNQTATNPLTTSPRAATPAGPALVQQASSGLAATACLMEARRRELTQTIRGDDSGDSSSGDARASRAHGGEKRSFSDARGGVSAAGGVMQADSGESCSHVPLGFSPALRSSCLRRLLIFQALESGWPRCTARVAEAFAIVWKTTTPLTCRVWNLAAVAAGAHKPLHVYEWTPNSRATHTDRLSAGIQSAKHAYPLSLKTAYQLPVRFYLQLTAHHRTTRTLSYGGAHMYSYTCTCRTLTQVLAL